MTMPFEPLELLIDVEEFLRAGGPVVRALLVLAILLWALIFERLIFYRTVMPKLLESIRTTWDSRAEHESWYAKKLKKRYVAEAERKIRGSLPMIRAFVALCPLVGLLGTVTGMIQVFEVMAVLGTGNAREMASGVSAATLPTLAGMVLALSGMYPIARFEHIVKTQARELRDHMVTTD
jgi:biopolymer transport protein ExbB